MAESITLQPVRTSPGLTWSASRADRVGVAVLALCLCGWHWRVTGALGANAAATLLLFVLLCFAYGAVFRRLVAPLLTSPAGVTFQLLTGYFVFNSLLFILALCSPLGMALNLAMLALVAVVGLVLCARHPAAMAEEGQGDAWASTAAILIACIGATIWCGDAQAPLPLVDGNVVFQVWPDTFIHAREISVFAHAHGIGSVQDIKLAGGRAPIYHFASYLSPAAVSALSGASAMQVYASFQLPLGIVLTGLAAYCLMSKLFGCWPAVAAVVAVVLFPDAFQHGFQNRYLSYYFLSQVNLGMLYGIACIALAWLFVLDGCRRGTYGTVLLGYGFLALCLFYKAHIFVANSYVLMMFPMVFFTRVRAAWRIALGVLATIVFCLVVAWSQTNPRVPVLRLDGSGIGLYLVQLLQDYEAGWMRHFFRRIFLQEKHSLPVQALYAAAMLLLSTFGVWLAALALVLAKGWRRMPPVCLWFPVIVIGNYLIMALGLAPDTRNVGTPDELINRPLVWAYFVTAAWTAAAACWLFLGDRRPQGRIAVGAIGATVLCATAAVYSAPNLQTFPGRFERATFVASGSVPACLVKAADYLRRESGPDDVVHDGSFDPNFIFTALSERQLYVGETTFGGKNMVHQARLMDVAALASIKNAEQLQHFARTRGVDWVLQNPDNRLDWPQAVQDRPAFSCGSYRLFRFPHVAAAPAAGSAATVISSNKGS
jgi:hypothetical protein